MTDDLMPESQYEVILLSDSEEAEETDPEEVDEIGTDANSSLQTNAEPEHYLSGGQTDQAAQLFEQQHNNQGDNASLIRRSFHFVLAAVSLSTGSSLHLITLIFAAELLRMRLALKACPCERVPVNQHIQAFDLTLTRIAGENKGDDDDDKAICAICFEKICDEGGSHRPATLRWDRGQFSRGPRFPDVQSLGSRHLTTGHPACFEEKKIRHFVLDICVIYLVE